ncbi:hypothetical protein [Parvularcula marina]|uniref:Flagellar protein FlgJ N-terminal domain-containing protein n=1 Tax=Parvularcula marina TaxID=2292771 RepID=A0A371RGY9_9PROT|nr:hypothetical protein [Parvularcula marina]RFB04728.1 hypothetical protein DX908_05205 [Parvularcula marina]
MIPSIPSSAAAQTQAASSSEPVVDEAREAQLRASAQEFEGVFIRQMLQYAGLAEAFGAEGQTADAFSTFLLDHLAEKITEQGGFGLAESFYNRLATADFEAEDTLGRRV